MAENPYIQQTNADAAQFFAQQNLAAQQNRGGGGGGSGNSLQEIMTGGQFQHGLDQKAADADLARKQEMAKLAFSQDMELRKVDAQNAGINQERANQYAQGQEATRNANAMAQQGQQNIFQQEEQAKQNTFVDEQTKKKFDNDKATALYALKLQTDAQYAVQLAELKLAQSGEGMDSEINKQLDEAKKRLQDIEDKNLAAEVTFSKSSEDRNKKRINQLSQLKATEKAKKEYIQPILAVTSQKKKMQIEGSELELSFAGEKGISLRLNTEGRDITGYTENIVLAGARAVETLTEFGNNDPTTASVDINKRLVNMSNPEYAKQIHASAINWNGGSLAQQIGREGMSDKETDIRSFRTQIATDSFMGVLESSNIPIADKAGTEKLFQNLMNKLQEKIGTKISTPEDIENAWAELNPILTELSKTMYNNEFNQAEVMDVFSAVSQGWAQDGVQLDDAVRKHMGREVSVDGNTVVLAGHADAFKYLGKTYGVIKTMSRNKVFTIDNITTLNAALDKAGGDVGAVLADPEMLKILTAADEDQAKQGKPSTRSVMEEIVSGARNEKQRIADVAKQKLDEGRRKIEIDRLIPKAESRKTANAIAVLEELKRLNLNRDKP